jgi:hypothetical protein
MFIKKVAEEANKVITFCDFGLKNIHLCQFQKNTNVLLSVPVLPDIQRPFMQREQAYNHFYLPEKNREGN